MKWLLLFLALPLSAQTSRGTVPSAFTGATNTMAFPSGSASGDTAVVQISSALATTCATTGGTAWTQAYSDGNTAYTSGAVFTRSLTSADITAGSVVCSTGNSANAGISFLTVYSGALKTVVYHGQGGGSTSVVGSALAVNQPAVVTYFTENRNDSASSAGSSTVNRGSIVGTQQSTASSTVIGALYSETIATNGTYTPTFSYSPAGNGYAWNAVITSPVAQPLTLFMNTDRVAYGVGTSVIATAIVSQLGSTGTVTFLDGATSVGTCTLAAIAYIGESGDRPGHRGCTSPITLSGASLHTLTASYGGDSNFSSSVSPAYYNQVNATQTSPQACSAMTVGLNGSLGGFVPNPNDDYHQAIDGLPADPNSSAIVTDIGANYINPDFSGPMYGYAGIPYYVADSSVNPGLTFGIRGYLIYVGGVGSSFTGTGSGTTLTAVSVAGRISIGDTVSGTGVPAGTTIVSQLTGTANGAGTYQTSATTTSSAATLTTYGNTLYTTNTGGHITIGDAVTSTGIPAGTTFTAQISGTSGGNGVYTISAPATAYIAPSNPVTGMSATNGGEFYPNDSDVVNVWPGAANTMWIESHYSAPQSDPNVGLTNSDGHLLILDKATCQSYEIYHAQQLLGKTPALTGSSTAIFNLNDTTIAQHRTFGLTTAEAGGLSIFEGLLRWDEVLSGTINHATRFQVQRFGCDYYNTGDCQTAIMFPALHSAYNSSSSTYQAYGRRYRLKASYSISGFSTNDQVILASWKKYGFITSDVGTSGFFSGTPDANWPQTDIDALKTIPMTAFEAVISPTQYTVSRYPSGTAATITAFTAAASTITSGSCTTLTATLANNPAYGVIDAVGYFSGGSKTATVCPTSTTTYNLTATNQFLAADDGYLDGHRNTSAVTVNVTGSITLPGLFGGNVTLQNLRHN